MGEVKLPELPDTPRTDENIDFSKYIFRAKIYQSGREGAVEGNLLFGADSIMTPDKKNIKLRDIYKISVLQWERRNSSGRNRFYPSRYELLFHDYRKINITGNIETLNRISFSGRKPAALYLYYYDYFREGKWVNSGINGYDALFVKPAHGCVVSIEFPQ